MSQFRQSKHNLKSDRQLQINWRVAMIFVGILAVLLVLFLVFHSEPELQSVPPDQSYENSSVSDLTDVSRVQDDGQDDPQNGSRNASNSPQPNPQPGNSALEKPLLSGNCTERFGILMLINPNFTMNNDFIATRKTQLISISSTYGIPEYHRAGNGDNLLLPEAATHLNDMINAYKATYPGHEMGTYSCFRSRGTSCGRLCAATGASDHHTGLTCDLIDLRYGESLNTDDYGNHLEWQWLRENSYKYGFIDRFPERWAGGPMSEPLNVDENGSTGLYETWHYRYVGVEAATEIATGKYNQGNYDSLEHYLKATNRVRDLKAGLCS